MSLKQEHADLGLPGYYEDGVQNAPARGYIGWAPGGDYMSGSGWSANMVCESWANFDGPDWDIDLNLVADFYFSYGADAKPCPACDRSGLAPEAKQLGDTFHGQGGWSHFLTEDEKQALVDSGRDPNGSSPWGHDAINRMICVETRAKRLGFEYRCQVCSGDGHLAVEPENLRLVLWLLHPRKGGGRGVTVKNIRVEDLPAVKAYLAQSLDAHTRHFAWAVK